MPIFDGAIFDSAMFDAEDVATESFGTPYPSDSESLVARMSTAALNPSFASEPLQGELRSTPLGSIYSTRRLP